MTKSPSERPASGLTRKTLTGATWMAGAFAAQIGVRLGVTMVLARLLTPADFGLVAIAITILVLCQTVAPLGTHVALLRLRDAGVAETKAAFTISLSAAIPLTAAAIAAAYAVQGPMQLPGLGLAMLTLSPAIALDAIGKLASRTLHKSMNFRPDTVASVMAYLVGYGGVGITLAYLGVGWIALCWAEVASAALLAGYLTWVGRPDLGVSFDAAVWRNLIGFGAPSTAANLIGWGSTNVPRLLIGALAGATALGLYARAADLSSRFGSFVDRLSTTVLFAAFCQRNDDRTTLAKALSAAASLMLVVILPGAAMLSALAHPLVLLLFGGQWAGAARAFAILAFVIPMQLLQRVSLVMAHSLGRPSAGIKTHSIFLVLALAGSAVGVPYGPEGVATAVLIASIGGSLAAFVMAAREVSLPLWTFWLAMFKGGGLAFGVFVACSLAKEMFADADVARQVAVITPTVAGLLFAVWLLGARWLFSEPANALLASARRTVGARFGQTAGRLFPA